MQYKNRKDAGEQLAYLLKKYRDDEVLVLGIPRGGAEVGMYLARALEAEYSILIATKIRHPFMADQSIGALAEDGSMFLNYQTADLNNAQLEEALSTERKELDRRIRLWRENMALPSMRGKTVILTDEGIASGSTLFASIKMCRHLGASRIVVAAPVSSPQTVRKIRPLVDEVVVPYLPELFYAVAQAYDHLPSLRDEELKEISRHIDQPALVTH